MIHNPKKAVILNAGQGQRLRPLTNEQPKCLLDIEGYSLLERQLANLQKNGITDITIVVGYLKELIIQKAPLHFPDMNFKFITNEEFLSTNTSFSLLLALQTVNEDFVYLNGDVLFDSRVIEALLKSPMPSCLAITKHKLSEEEVKVLVKDDSVIAIGKNLSPDLSYGEFIGIAKFSKKVCYDLKEKLEAVIASEGGHHYFEYALNQLLEIQNISLVDITDYPSIEVDTYSDLLNARIMAEGIR